METFSLYSHVSNQKASRNKIFLPQNLISLLEEGEKIVQYAGVETTVTASQIVILSSGNCLMTEKLPVNNSYRSTLLFFDNTALGNFFKKYAVLIKNIPPEANNETQPFTVFEKDDFIRNYMASLNLIISKPSLFSNKLIELKFEELLLHLLEKYPNEILSFQHKNHNRYSDFEIRKVVELNVTNNLTLEELAFLCHMSVSTFRRKFMKLYQLPPSQYFLRQKMKIAQSLLLNEENPSEVYYKVGYESHSGFSQSFKQLYGMSPKQFQLENLTASKQHLND